MQEHTTLRVESTPPTVDDALALAQCGIRVVPLKPGTKEPAITAYAHEATTDPATLRRWWCKWPSANIGHIVGPHELVLDVDPRHNGLVGWQNLLAQHGPLPATWTVHSGRQDGGFHLHFAVPAGVVIPYCTPLAGKGVEALGQGHNVVMPPSVHPDTGLQYTWAEEHAPFDFCVQAMAPDWLIDVVLTTAKRHGCTPSPKMAKLPPLPQGYTASGIAAAATNKYLPGGARGTCLSIPKLASSVSEHAGTSAPIGALLTTASHVPALQAACGLPVPLQVGDALCCTRHDDTQPSAIFVGPTDGHPSYGICCFAAACLTERDTAMGHKSHFYSLVDLYKAQESAGLLSIHTEEDANGYVHDHHALWLQWATRLCEAAGLWQDTDHGCPMLPPEASAVAKAVWQAFRQTRRLRSVTQARNAPFPFSLRYIQDWLGAWSPWTFDAIKKAWAWLKSGGYVMPDGKDSRGNQLWRIAPAALRKVFQHDPVAERLEKDVVATLQAAPLAIPTIDALVEVPAAHAFPCGGAADFSPEACPTCQAQARLLEKRHLYGTPRLVERVPDWGHAYAEETAS